MFLTTAFNISVIKLNLLVISRRRRAEYLMTSRHVLERPGILFDRHCSLSAFARLSEEFWQTIKSVAKLRLRHTSVI